ncbi:MAG: hypothetical protein D0530_02220 [Methylococcales bacterium]|jgi:hypothetical protein|nr:MAG: hypothetical protein D0530_02220 [Methylococcales bacterium]
MSVSHRDFYNSAEVLLSNPDSTEMDFRNVISRSYFAVFQLSREIASKLPLTIDPVEYQKLDIHDKVIIRFEKNPDKRIQSVSYLIKQLRALGMTADYDTHLDIKRLESTQHFYAAQRLLSSLEGLLAAINSLENLNHEQT